MSDFPSFRDNSLLLTYRECPLKFRYKYQLGLCKIEEGATEHDKNFGKAIHEALALWNQGRSKEDGISAFTKAYPAQLDPEDKAKTQENGVLLLDKYYNRYNTDRDKYEVIAVEERLDFKVGERDFCVKLDTVVKDKKYGQVYSLEHKTTKKSLNYDYWGQYTPNSQLCAQTAGVKHKYGECAGVIVDAMSLGFRQRAYKGEAAGFHCDFGRMEFNINEDQVIQWMSSTEKTLQDIENDLSSQRWAMHTGACRFCSYKPICSAAWDWEHDQELILLSYERKDPFEYLTVGQEEN